MDATNTPAHPDLANLQINKSPGFAVIYRWRLHPGKEELFIQTWTRISELLYEQRGSLGSRLHKGSDGIWYSYAQWPSAQARELAFAQGSVSPELTALQHPCIAEMLPEIVLEPISDLMVLPTV